MMHKRNQGFTLIEVLVALIILAIALFAIFKSIQDSIKDTIAVRNNLASHWIALNVASSLQSGLLQPPTITKPLSGKTLALNQNWQWHANFQQQNQWSQRILITVNRANQQRSWQRMLISVRKQY